MEIKGETLKDPGNEGECKYWVGTCRLGQKLFIKTKNNLGRKFIVSPSSVWLVLMKDQKNEKIQSKAESIVTRTTFRLWKTRELEKHKTIQRLWKDTFFFIPLTLVTRWESA